MDGLDRPFVFMYVCCIISDKTAICSLELLEVVAGQLL
jgi:hypothetical protein